MIYSLDLKLSLKKKKRKKEKKNRLKRLLNEWYVVVLVKLFIDCLET